MNRRRRKRNSANIIYSRNYYTCNYCRYLNCIFNKNGRCFRLKRERGKKPLTYNKGCFMSAIEGKSMAEIRKYFRGDSYLIKRELLPDHLFMDEFYKPPEFRKVKIERIKDPTQVEVTYKAGDHVQHSTLFLRDLFAYELKKREKEYKEEEKRLGKYVDFDAIRADNQVSRAA